MLLFLDCVPLIGQPHYSGFAVYLLLQGRLIRPEAHSLKTVKDGSSSHLIEEYPTTLVKFKVVFVCCKSCFIILEFPAFFFFN